MKTLRKFWLRLFPQYRRLEAKFVTYRLADQMIRHTAELPEAQQWQIAKEEDDNTVPGYVHLERRERITS